MADYADYAEVREESAMPMLCELAWMYWQLGMPAAVIGEKLDVTAKNVARLLASREDCAAEIVGSNARLMAHHMAIFREETAKYAEQLSG